MLRILILGFACVFSTVLAAQNVGISNVALLPDASAVLDINSVTTGILVPRMTEAQRLAIPTAGPENSLLVYQTDVGAGTDTTNARGFWYWDNNGAQWVHLDAVRRGWLIDGNTVTAVTGANPEFLGTLGAVAGYLPQRELVFRTGPGPVTDPPAMQMGHDLLAYNSGFVGLGTAAPATERLEVEGAIRVGQSDQLSPPREGTIRYGTIDGGPQTGTTGSPAYNLNWHWGTLDTVNQATGTHAPLWQRLENAEELVLNKPYPKDTTKCPGGIGDAYRGNLSPTPVTQTTNTPANIYSPFATNYNPANTGVYKVQYLYRNAELVEAGFCFPATIYSVSFFCLDQETMTPDPTFLAEWRMRGGAPGNAALQGAGAYFGLGNTVPFMDDPTRLSAVRGSGYFFLPSPGWLTFNLTTPISLAAGQNLIIELTWIREAGTGVGPRVELEDAGFTCTKWVLCPTCGLGDMNPLEDAPAYTGGIVAPTAANPHNWRPVTRFSATVASPDVVERTANYLQYDGGIMIGDAAWANAPGNFTGPGTVKAQNGVYDGKLKLSDHVFDRYFDGTARADAQGTQYHYTGLAQLRERLERDRHLPNMPGRDQWEASGGASLGTLATGLWETVEDQALYITQLQQDLATLETMSFGGVLTPEKADRLISEVKASRRLTEAQKAHLIESIAAKAKNHEGQ